MTPAPGNSKPDSAYSSCAGAFAPSRSWFGRLPGEGYPVSARGLGCRRYRVCEPPSDAIYAIGSNTRGCYNVWRIDRTTGKASKLAFIPSYLRAITGDADGLYIAHDRYRLTDDGPFATLTALGFDGKVRWRIDQSELPLHVDDEPYGMTGLGVWTYSGGPAWSSPCSLAAGEGKLFVRHGRAHEYWDGGPPYYGSCISDWLTYKYPGIDLVALSTADGSLIWKAGRLSSDMNPYIGGSGGDPVYTGGRLFAASSGWVGYLDPRPDGFPDSAKPCNCQPYNRMLNAELDPGTGRTIQTWSSDYAGGPMVGAAGGSLLYKLGYFGGNYVTRISTGAWQCANRPSAFNTRSGTLWVCAREAVAFGFLFEQLVQRRLHRAAHHLVQVPADLRRIDRDRPSNRRRVRRAVGAHLATGVGVTIPIPL